LALCKKAQYVVVKNTWFLIERRWFKKDWHHKCMKRNQRSTHGNTSFLHILYFSLCVVMFSKVISMHLCFLIIFSTFFHILISLKISSLGHYKVLRFLLTRPKFLVRPKEGPTMSKCGSSWNLVPLPASSTKGGGEGCAESSMIRLGRGTT
jgi:hypothetical protein